MRNRIVNIGNVKAGGQKLFLIAGPTVIEEEITLLKTAEKLRLVSEKLDVPVLFRASFLKEDRASLKHYAGPGMDNGLRVLQKIKDMFGLALVTDIHYPYHIKPVAEVVDVLEIPANVSLQTSLLADAAQTGKAVNLVQGPLVWPEAMQVAAQIIAGIGNENILLTEAGRSFGNNNTVPDPRALVDLRSMGYPVVFDVTHGIGYSLANKQNHLPAIAGAAVGAGVDGLNIAVHPYPSEALCDSNRLLELHILEEFLKPLIELHEVAAKYRQA